MAEVRRTARTSTGAAHTFRQLERFLCARWELLRMSVSCALPGECTGMNNRTWETNLYADKVVVDGLTVAAAGKASRRNNFESS